MKNSFVLTFIFCFCLAVADSLAQPVQLVDFAMQPECLTDYNGALYFKAGSTPQKMQLWKTDGTQKGTSVANDKLILGLGTRMLSSNGNLFFCAKDMENNLELWKTDGTQTGTLLVKEINEGAEPSSPSYLTDVNGIVFFSADDGKNGIELWKTDGTERGTVLVKDINPGLSGSSPRDLINVNGNLYFMANDGIHGHELWKSYGTASGTYMIKDSDPGSESSYVTNRFVEKDGNVYFFQSNLISGYRLWKTDGTSTGTKIVKDLSLYSLDSDMSLIVFNDKIYFSARPVVADTIGVELWRSDGTSEGTVMVKDINTSYGHSSFPKYLGIMNGSLIFNATEWQKGEQLWKSDGTVEGTVSVKYLESNFWYNPDPSGFIFTDSLLYFLAVDSSGRNLWQTNGTEAGTTKVGPFLPLQYQYIEIDKSLKVGNVLYYLIPQNGWPNQATLWSYNLPTITTDLPAYKVELQCRVFPIPSDGQIQIMVPEQFIGGQVVVYDSQGVLVLEEFITGYLSSISLGNVIPGVYVVKISKGNSALVRKIIKN